MKIGSKTDLYARENLQLSAGAFGVRNNVTLTDVLLRPRSGSPAILRFDPGRNRQMVVAGRYTQKSRPSQRVFHKWRPDLSSMRLAPYMSSRMMSVHQTNHIGRVLQEPLKIIGSVVIVSIHHLMSEAGEAHSAQEKFKAKEIQHLVLLPTEPIRKWLSCPTSLAISHSIQT